MSTPGQLDLRALVASIPFADRLGVELDSATPEEVRGRLAWAPELCTLGGILHGGSLMAFADTLGAICAFGNLPEGTTTATIESKSNLFRSVREGTVHGVSVPLHVGRTTIVVQTDLRDDADRRIAQTTQTQIVVPART